MQAMKEMKRRCTAFRHRKTEKGIIQLYVDYITKGEVCFVSECFENKHI